MCCNCPGQILHIAWDTSNPAVPNKGRRQHLAIHHRLQQDVSRGNGLGSCFCFLLLNSLRPQERIEGFLDVQDGWARGPQRTSL